MNTRNTADTAKTAQFTIIDARYDLHISYCQSAHTLAMYIEKWANAAISMAMKGL